jgi:NADPH:quinone reductase-like Zn-dependent oxidoreductase
MEDTTFPAVMTDLKKPFMGEGQIRDLKADELLVKVHSAPVHPADQGFCRGYYGNKDQLTKPSYGCGFEGAGEVIDIGGEVGEEWKGKRVALFQGLEDEGYEGTYRKYLYINKDRVVEYPSDADYDLIACANGNPLTICGFIDYCHKNNHVSVINDAACSSCGRIFIKAAKEYGIKLINLVRNEEHIKTLEELGADVILNYSCDEFPEQLNKAIEEHKPTGYFTCVAGEVATYVFSQMPKHSSMYIYGFLSMESITYEPKDVTLLFLIFRFFSDRRQSAISGFQFGFKVLQKRRETHGSKSSSKISRLEARCLEPKSARLSNSQSSKMR